MGRTRGFLVARDRDRTLDVERAAVPDATAIAVAGSGVVLDGATIDGHHRSAHGIGQGSGTCGAHVAREGTALQSGGTSTVICHRVIDAAHVAGTVVLKGAVGRRKRTIIPDGADFFGCGVILEDDIGGGHRVTMRNVDSTAVVGLTALDAAAGYRTRQRQAAAAVRPNHVAGTIVASKTAAKLMAVQVDGHRLVVDIEVTVKLNVSSKLNVRTVGDGTSSL